MRFKSLISTISVGSAIIATSLLLSNCTCKISEEDYAKLQDLRKEERNLMSEIGKKKDEKSRLEGEMKARQSEANKCNEEKDFVQKKLTQWPNVWPDYTPQPE
jgi:uncharacterized protein (DUF3084 family)